MQRDKRVIVEFGDGYDYVSPGFHFGPCTEKEAQEFCEYLQAHFKEEPQQLRLLLGEDNSWVNHFSVRICPADMYDFDIARARRLIGF